MSSRGGGVFEDFKPTSEWQQDHLSHILTVSLPAAFTYEQIIASLFRKKNIIRVRGERPVAGNKWSRFLEDFQIPDNAQMDSICRHYENGTLTITIPKKITTHIQHELHKPDDEIAQVQRESNEKQHITASKINDENSVINRVGNEISAKKMKMEKAVKGLYDDLNEEKHITASKRNEDSVINRVGNEISAKKMKMEKAVKGLYDELSEEKQQLMKIGAAVLIIAAIGAYFTYKSVSRKHAN